MFKRQLFVALTVLSTLLGLSFFWADHFPTLSAANHIIISQVQISGATTTDEFVELFNPTGSDVDLAGWRLTRKTQSGSQSNLVASLSGTIPAGGYFLIAHSLAGYDGLVTPDTFYSAQSNNISSNNTVLLYSDAGVTRIDAVGLGTASDVETTSIANPPAHSSVVRQLVLDDTNNNSIDFVILPISDPRNSEFVSSPTPTQTSLPSPSPVVTSTPSPMPTATPTAEPTDTPQITATPQVTAVPSVEPTSTPTASPVPTVEPTATPTSAPQISTPHPRVLGEFSFRHRKVKCRLEYKEVRIHKFHFWFPRIRFERD